MGKTSALWLKEIREHLPWFVLLTVINKIELAWTIPWALQQNDPLESVGNVAMFAGRWPDEWPITFMFYGALFGLWGYFIFHRHRKTKADVMLRTIPVSSPLPAAIRMGAGLVLVALIFLIDMLITFEILDAVRQSDTLMPGYKTFFLLRKGLMAMIYGAWFIAGCWAAQWRFRWRRWYPLLLVGLLAFAFAFNVLLMVIDAMSESVLLLMMVERHKIVFLVIHGVIAIVLGGLVLRGEKRWEVA